MLIRPEKHFNHPLSRMAEKTSLAGTPVNTLDVHHSQHCEVCFVHRVGPPNTHTCNKCECGLCNVLCFGKYHTIIHLFYIHTGETGRLLGIRLREQKNNLREGLFSKSTQKSIHSHTLPTVGQSLMYTTPTYVHNRIIRHTHKLQSHTHFSDKSPPSGRHQYIYTYRGQAVVHLVEALCYKLESRWFDSCWCH
jgi:hypothetical protein